MKKWIVATLVVCFSTMSFAHEHEHGQGGQGQGACAKDRETLCGNIEPGEGRVMKCMKENKDKLSAECKAQHEKMKKQMKDVSEACQEDVEKFCSDTKPGKGRIMRCMKEHKEELSAECKAEVAEAKDARKKMKKGN